MECLGSVAMFFIFKVGALVFIMVGMMTGIIIYIVLWGGMVIFCEWELVCFNSIRVDVPMVFDL
jgi:hypothetical protein